MNLDITRIVLPALPPAFPPPPTGYVDPAEFGETVTVAQLVEYWKKTRRSKMKEKSFGHAARIMGQVVTAFGQYPAMKLRPFHVVAWIKSCQSWGVGMRHKVAQTILALFNHAEAHGVIDRNPIRGIRKEFEPGKPRPEATAEQFQGLIRWSTDQAMRRLIVFIGWTGCRQGEAGSMCWPDVNRQDHVVVLADHKTAKVTGEPRRIPLMPPAYKLLKWMYERAEDREGRIFLTAKGKQWNPQIISTRMVRLLHRAGIPRGITLHCLRHRWITNLIARGVPVKIAGEAAGHKSIKTTERYCHLDQRTDVVLDWLEMAYGHGDDDLPIPPPVDPPGPRQPRTKPLQTNKVERHIAICRKSIRELLANGRMRCLDLVACLREKGYSYKTINQARMREGVVYKQSGFGGPRYVELSAGAIELPPEFGG